MSYYDLGGARGGFVSYVAYPQKRIAPGRWLLVTASLLVVAASYVAIGRVLSSVEYDRANFPAVIASAAPPPSLKSAPAVVSEQARSSELQKKLEVWASEQQSDWGFYVRSLGSDELAASVRAEQSFEMASIYKLFLLKPLSERLPSETWASREVSGRSYQACVEAMLAVSNNPCAEAIAGQIGWTTTHKQIQMDGYRQTVLNREDFFTSTAKDAGLLLERLYRGDGYDARTKQIALGALATPKGSAEAIRKSCVGCNIYNKTGDLAGYRHDAAIVEKDGKAYVIVIFSKGASWQQVGEAASLITSEL